MGLSDDIKDLEQKHEASQKALVEVQQRANELELKLKNTEGKLEKANKKIRKYEESPLQEKVKELQKELKEAGESRRVAKLKSQLRTKDDIIAREQKLRMNAENKPEVVKENEDLKKKVATLEADLKNANAGARELLGLKKLLADAGVGVEDLEEEVAEKKPKDDPEMAGILAYERDRQKKD